MEVSIPLLGSHSGDCGCSPIYRYLSHGHPFPRVSKHLSPHSLSQGIKVRISGRLGRKAEMATIKDWEHGDSSMGEVHTPIDYGTATALTRMGVTGEPEVLVICINLEYR